MCCVRSPRGVYERTITRQPCLSFGSLPCSISIIAKNEENVEFPYRGPCIVDVTNNDQLHVPLAVEVPSEHAIGSPRSVARSIVF